MLESLKKKLIERELIKGIDVSNVVNDCEHVNILKLLLKEEELKVECLSSVDQFVESHYPGFNSDQYKAIKTGVAAGADISVFANSAFNADKMNIILNGLLEGVDASIYANASFDSEQMDALYRGLKEGVDVSIYSNPLFNCFQMEEILNGLVYKVDVSKYADPEMNWSQMAEVRMGLQSGVDISGCAKLFSWNVLTQIRKGLKNGIDLLTYAKLGFDQNELEQILLGLEMNLDVSSYARIKFNHCQMSEIREGLISGINVKEYANPSLSSDEMRNIRMNLEGRKSAKPTKEAIYKRTADLGAIFYESEKVNIDNQWFVIVPYKDCSKIYELMNRYLDDSEFCLQADVQADGLKIKLSEICNPLKIDENIVVDLDVFFN